MGRRAKPLALHIADGNPAHLTHAAQEARRKAEAEMSVGIVGDLQAPKHLKKNRRAMNRWKEVVELYRGTELATSADTQVLARYCETYAEYLDLLDHRRTVQTVEFPPPEEKECIDEFENQRKNRMWAKVEYILSLDGLLTIDAALNKKNQILTQLEDHLFLNPLARVKNIPKSAKQQKQDPLEAAGFGNV